MIYGLVVAFKPRFLLEIGLGAGRSNQAIRDAMGFNQVASELTVVEDWRAWEGQPLPRSWHGNLVNISEQNYVAHCISAGVHHDFIVSDADHGHANEWFSEVFDDILSPGGVLIYHDICNENHPNLFQITKDVEFRSAPYFIVNKSTRSDEECERGLLVIFKFK